MANFFALIYLILVIYVIAGILAMEYYLVMILLLYPISHYKRLFHRISQSFEAAQSLA